MNKPPRPPVKTALGAAEDPEERRVYISDAITPRLLAEQLRLKPFQMISDAMAEGEFHSLDSKMGFQIAGKIALRHGFTPIREDENRT